MISSTSVNYLNLNLSKGERWQATGKLDVKPFVKPTKQGIILHSSSMHHPTVHASWPLGQYLDFVRLSDSKRKAKPFQLDFISRLKAYDSTHPSLVNLYLALGGQQVAKQSSLGEKSSWLIIPYHPAWLNSRIFSIIASFNRAIRMKAMVENDPELLIMLVSLGYRNAGKHFSFKVPSNNSKM